ncbi:MAG: MATE family multidrug resistance protein [Myxococcota bacterium]
MCIASRQFCCARELISTKLSGLRDELSKLTELAVPVAIAQVGSMLMGTVDTMMVGRVGESALAASAIGNAWFFAVLLMGQGVIHGIDPIVSQAHGAGDGRTAGLALQRGIVMALVLSVPLCLGLAYTNEALLALGQDPALAAAAHEYVAVQIPSLPIFLVFIALRQYLQGRALMRPGMWVIAIANVLNVGFNWVLIFGGFGIPALGLFGAGIATCLTRASTLLMLVVWVSKLGLHEGAWVAWSRSAYSLRALLVIWRSGWPVAMHMSLEIWAFSLGTLIAGMIDATSVAAHTIVLNLAALSFMMALGISHGVVTRVGNLIGAGDPERAQHSAWVGIAMGAFVMSLGGLGFLVFRHQLPGLYTSDVGIIAAGSAVLPIAAAFQIFDGTQAVGSGVLRGMGRTLPSAAFNFIGYWVLGLPIGAWLALRGGFGLAGIWWGFVIGLAFVAVSIVMWIVWKGPSSLVVSDAQESAQ